MNDKGGGASLAPYYEFESKIPSDVKAQVTKLSEEILGGNFVVEINDEDLPNVLIREICPCSR